MNFGIASVTGITLICYLVGITVKRTKLSNQWIPPIVGFAGGILGLVGLYVMADFPANEPISAIAVGIASGLASTGIHQIKKQLSQEEEHGTD